LEGIAPAPRGVP